MEKSRLIVILIFITAIPVIISKTAQEITINALANGFIRETNRNFNTEIACSLRSIMDQLALVKYDTSKSSLEKFRDYFKAFASISVVRKNYTLESTAGAMLNLEDNDADKLRKALLSGKSMIFFKIGKNNIVYAHLLCPFLDQKENDWKCIYAIVDISQEMVKHTKPIQKPFHLFKYLYDDKNEIIFPSYSNMDLGLNIIKSLKRAENVTMLKSGEYWINSTQISLKEYFIDVAGLGVVTVIPKSFIGKIMMEYRVKVNVALIVIAIVLTLLFIGVYRNYLCMMKESKSYKDIIQDAGVAVVLYNIKSGKITNSNKIAHNVFLVENGTSMMQLFSKDEDRRYLQKILDTIGTLYNYKTSIKAKYNEEVSIILSMSKNDVIGEIVMTFFEPDAVVEKKAKITLRPNDHVKNSESVVFENNALHNDTTGSVCDSSGPKTGTGKNEEPSDATRKTGWEEFL